MVGRVDSSCTRSVVDHVAGFVHMAINLTVVVLFTVNFWIRGTAHASAIEPVWLSGIGIALLIVSGWLGGEMVYRHGVGVAPAELAEGEAREFRTSPSGR
jgi:uncharacterized membrane protein